MSKERGYWVGRVPPEIQEKLESLKEIGFTYGQVFRRAVKVWLKQGISSGATDLIQDRLETLGLEEKETE